MLRYFCREFTGNRDNHRQSAEFFFQPLPPKMVVIVYDYADRTTWGIQQDCWNAQSRLSLESLRPSEAWRMNCGFMGTGEFRAIRPTTVFDVLPLSISFNVEVSWFPAFANLTADVGSSYVLYSVRPAEGERGWRRLDFGPPNVAYIRPEDLTNHEGNPPPTTEPADPITLVQVTQNTVINQTATIEVSSGSNDIPDDPITIVEENPRVVPFAFPVQEEIPFSHHPEGGPNLSEITRVRNSQRPITVQEFDPHGMLPFELAMQFVREENRARLGGHFGTRPPPNQSRAILAAEPRIEEVDESTAAPENAVNQPLTVTSSRLTSPAINIPPHDVNQPAVRPTVIPSPPNTPKPPPPPFPPSLGARLRRTMTPATGLTVRTISNLSARFHPQLRTIEYLRPELLSPSIPTRTGLVNPPLPKAPAIATPIYGVSPSPLRTTREGIRLEITPVAMVLQTQPENHIPVAESVGDLGTDATGAPLRPSTPELDPEQ